MSRKAQGMLQLGMLHVFLFFPPGKQQDTHTWLSHYADRAMCCSNSHFRPWFTCKFNGFQYKYSVFQYFKRRLSGMLLCYKPKWSGSLIITVSQPLDMLRLHLKKCTYKSTKPLARCLWMCRHATTRKSQSLWSLHWIWALVSLWTL